jgi:hypothetical protein
MGTYRRARLEKTGSHCRCVHSEECGYFAWLVSLEIDEVEHLPLAGRKPSEEMTDILGHSLPVDACAGISVVHFFRFGKRGFAERSTPLRLAMFAQCNVAHDSIHPSLDGRVTAILPKLAVNEDESFLRYFLSFVPVTRECHGPAMNISL